MDKNRFTVTLEAMKQNGLALQYVSNEFKNDPSIVLEAVKQNGHALEYTPDELKGRPSIVLEAVKQNGLALGYASNELKNDEILVLKAVEEDGNALTYASIELKNNPNIVLIAVKQTDNALKYASDKLKNDHDIVLEAVKLNIRTLSYASKELKNDPNYILELMKECGNDAVHYASYLARRAIVNGYPLIEETFDENIVLEAVKQNGLALQHASNELKSSYKFILEAVKQNPVALLHASSELQKNTNLIIEAACSSQPHSPRWLLSCRHHYQTIRDVLIPFKYTFLSTILFGLSICYEKKENSLMNKNSFFSSTTTAIQMDSLSTSSNNSLQQLNRLGSYEVLDFKKKLADYLGVKFSLVKLEKAIQRIISQIEQTTN